MFIIKHGTFKFDVLFCVDATDEQVYKKIHKLGYCLSDDEKQKLKIKGLGRTVMLDNHQTVIRIKKLKDNAKNHGNIAHEIFHAVEFLYYTVSIPYSLENGETWAYQIDHLINQVYSQIKL